MSTSIWIWIWDLFLYFLCCNTSPFAEVETGLGEFAPTSTSGNNVGRSLTVCWFFVGDVPRVDGQLAVARAFGDKSLKRHLSSEPDVAVEMIDDDTDFVIFASDGLWTVCYSLELILHQFSFQWNFRRS